MKNFRNLCGNDPKLVNSSGIYKLQSKINNKIYIGKTLGIKRRINCHLNELKENKHDNIFLQRHVNKYGINDIDWKIILICEQKNLCDYEKKIIKLYKSNNKKYGFNLTEGGESFIPLFKKTSLQNLKTGQIINTDSRSQACRITGVRNSNMADLCNERITKSHDWCLPKNYEKLLMKFVSPEGKLIVVSDYKTLEKISGIKKSCFVNICRGFRKSCFGWRKYSFPSDLVPYNEVIYKFVLPDGNLIETKSIVELAKKYNLEHKKLGRVNCGVLSNYNGFRKFNTKTDLIPFKEKTYHVISPLGEKIEINSISKFAEENGFNIFNIYALLKNKTKSYKGWRLDNGDPNNIKPCPSKIIIYIKKIDDNKIYSFERRSSFPRTLGLTVGNVFQLTKFQKKVKGFVFINKEKIY